MVGILFLSLSVFLFSTMELTSKFISDDFNFIQLTFLRFFLGTFVFIFFIVFKKDLRKELENLNIKMFLKLSSLGFLNVFISMLLLQYSVEKGNASIAAVLIGSHPIFVYILNLIFFKEFDRIKLIKIFLGILGILFLILFSGKITKTINYIPSITGLLSSFFFALFTFLSKRFLKNNSTIIVNFICFFSGIIFLLPFFLYKNNYLLKNINLSNSSILIYLGFFVTGCGYLFYYEGFKRLNVVDGSMIFFLKPLLGSILAVIILKEKLNLYQFLGIILIIISLTNFRKGNRVENNNRIKKDNDN
ncbi:MAG: DMT family transporter [candidate division WOR-3 bacterium]